MDTKSMMLDDEIMKEFAIEEDTIVAAPAVAGVAAPAVAGVATPAIAGVAAPALATPAVTASAVSAPAVTIAAGGSNNNTTYVSGVRTTAAPIAVAAGSDASFFARAVNNNQRPNLVTANEHENVYRQRGRAAGIRKQQDRFMQFLYRLSSAYRHWGRYQRNRYQRSRNENFPPLQERNTRFNQ